MLSWIFQLEENYANHFLMELNECQNDSYGFMRPTDYHKDWEENSPAASQELINVTHVIFELSQVSCSLYLFISICFKHIIKKERHKINSTL